MKSINIFNNIALNIVTDAHVSKYGSMLLTRGIAGGAKLNPTIIWVDATIAVIEAVRNYFRYCSVCTATKQLCEYNHALEITLAQDFSIRNLKIESLAVERHNRLKHIERSLEATHIHTRLTQKKLQKQLNLLKQMYNLLQQERLQSGGFKKLIDLQVCLDECIDTTLMLLLTPTGE